jgi:type II secretory pathway pseudopilin PulG
MRLLQNRRSGFSAESRTLNLLEKCGGLPTAATMKGSFSEVSDNDLTTFPAMKELIATRRRQTGSAGAFTLTELLVVMGVGAMLAAVLLSASFTTRERVLRAECVSNLRQIGVGLNLYSTEANGYLPICGWRSSIDNPWETYQACRFDYAGSTNIILGFENLGLLFRPKAVLDPKTFYCPSTALINSTFSYDFYATAPSGWPSIPVGYTGNPYVRMGYNYYPQLRATEWVNDAIYGPLILPKLTYSSVQLEFGGLQNVVTPAKLTEVNPQKSITTDLAINTDYLSHLV